MTRDQGTAEARPPAGTASVREEHADRLERELRRMALLHRRDLRRRGLRRRSLA